MIFLILKMFVYLLLALLAGAGAGWMLRHIAAIRQDEETQRTLADARARVPQFESLIRSRDEQISRLKEELKDKDVRINGLVEDVREAELAFKDKDRALKQLTAQNATLEELGGNAEGAGSQPLLMSQEPLAADAAPGTGAASDAALSGKVAHLEAELKEASAQVADAMAEAAAAEAEVITLKAELARATALQADSGDGAESEGGAVTELKTRLEQKTAAYDRLARELEAERRRVVELERERELQNKSLQVLHQQLDLEKERGQRVASG